MFTKRNFMVGLGVIVFALAAASVTEAKGLFQEIVIESQPDNAGGVMMIEITDPLLLSNLPFFIFDNQQEGRPTLDIAAGFSITRGHISVEGFEPFDRVVYYPATSETPAWIYYVGLVEAAGNADGWSEYDGRWFLATPEGEATLEAILNGEESPWALSFDQPSLFDEALQIFRDYNQAVATQPE